MKRLFFALVLYVVTVGMHAIPAKPGLWRVLTLKDGTEVRAQLTGYEFCHYWRTDDGRNFVKSGEAFIEVPEVTMSHRAQSRRAARRASAMTRRTAIGERTHFIGKKKGLVILAEFKDVSFKTANDQEKYNKILNEEGYTTREGFEGSVADYFKAQSGGQFEVEFDVFGPVQLANNQKYYGQNDEYDHHSHSNRLFIKKCHSKK